MSISFLKNKKNNLRALRLTGILEGISYLMLFGITMPLKYSYDMPTPNYVVGLVHGVLFVSFVFLTILVYNQFSISKKDTLTCLSKLPIFSIKISFKNGELI